MGGAPQRRLSKRPSGPNADQLAPHLPGGLAQPGVIRRRVDRLRQEGARPLAVALCLRHLGKQAVDRSGRAQLARPLQRLARRRPCPGLGDGRMLEAVAARWFNDMRRHGKRSADEVGGAVIQTTRLS